MQNPETYPNSASVTDIQFTVCISAVGIACSASALPLHQLTLPFIGVYVRMISSLSLLLPIIPFVLFFSPCTQKEQLLRLLV